MSYKEIAETLGKTVRAVDSLLFRAKTNVRRVLAEDRATNDAVRHFGFVSGEQKNALLREADLFCFPTYYQNENQPVNFVFPGGRAVPSNASGCPSVM